MLSATLNTGRSSSLPEPAPLPKAPILGWDSFWPRGSGRLPSVADLPNKAYTSSGRAALHAALRQLALPKGSGVLVPTYHCPTMVAPIVEAGLQPVFYPLDDLGMPALARISFSESVPRVMFVAHFFGLARSLAAIRDWCDLHGIVMIEDCAHSFLGMAGERPVGEWGDYATASLSKFFPVPEAGLLASATRALKPMGLAAPGMHAELRSAWDVLDRARAHGQLRGLTHTLAPLFWLRGSRHPAPVTDPASLAEPDDDAIRKGCDMGRIGQAPTAVSRLLHVLLPCNAVAARRRDNYTVLATELQDLPGACPLVRVLQAGWAPYVLPLRVHDTARADALYARMRAARMPVFRWDRLWPGTPQLPGDIGMDWSRQVLQLLCHQSLSPVALAAMVAHIRTALASSASHS